MKILCLSWHDLYATGRFREAAQAGGIDLDTCEIFDVNFFVQDGKIGLYRGEIDLIKTYDVLIVRTFHPYISEALTIARLFRDAGRIVIDRSLTDQGYAVSKMHDYLLLAQAGLSVPRSWQIYDPREVEQVAARVGYPCVLKGVHGAQGNHVHMIRGADDLYRLLWRYPTGELMLQEYLPGAEDYRVITVGSTALPLMVSRRAPSGDFRTNFAIGGTFTKRSLEEFPTFAALAEGAARVLRREFAAVDIRMRGATPLILEVNRRPDFEGFERATGFDVATTFLNYVVEQYTRCAPSGSRS
ncbi:MAG TPA: ATP-grasp domain-containing protein [Aggregatilineales bacterium]|nr:ATP-grasp domain-containing protein [Aggregatilineales bacterium]